MAAPDVTRLHRRIGCTHRQPPGGSAYDSQLIKRMHKNNGASNIQMTSAESIENLSYLVWHNTQIEEDGELRSRSTCGK